MKEFIVNEYITLKLEDGKVNIYVNGELFRQCKFLLINIPIEEISSFDDIESIDEAAERLSRNLEHHKIEIPPETEFWGHCSNLQVWVENNYDTKLLAQNLAFPLLKKLSSLDPIARRIFKEEIAKRFSSGNKTVILYLLKQKYIDYLETQEEKEMIFYKNNGKLRELLDNLLKEKGRLLFDGISIVKVLIRMGDLGTKEFLKTQIINAFNLGDIFMLDIYETQSLFYFFDSEEREIFYYKNNEKLRRLIEGSLEHEEYSLKFGFPLLLMLYNLKDFSVKEVLKKGVMKWLFSGSEDTIKTIIEKYIRPILGSKIFRYKGKILEQQIKLFNYEELKNLCEDPSCPLQLYNYWNDYKEEFNKIYCFTKEKILTREELLMQNITSSNIRLPNSKLFVVLYDERKKKKRPFYRPIDTNKLKKIIINNSESSIEPIISKIEKLRTHLHILYEEINCFHIEKGLVKNVIVLYLLDSIVPNYINQISNLANSDIILQIKGLSLISHH